MRTSQFAFGIGAVLFIGATASGVASYRAMSGSRTLTATLRAETDAATRQLTTVRADIAVKLKAVDGVERDNAVLTTAIQEAVVAREARMKRAQVTITREMVDSRYARGKELAQAGDAEGALQEFLWCFNEGMPRISGFAGVRASYLLREILALGAIGEAALRDLREHARASIVAGDTAKVLDFGALSRALKDPAAPVALYDSLPVGDPRRRSLAISAFEQFVDAQRYADAVAGRSLSSMITQLEVGMKPNQPPRLREFTIASAARNIEVLAGAGQIENAKTLIARLLSFESSEPAKAKVLEHLTRAGRPELLREFSERR